MKFFSCDNMSADSILFEPSGIRVSQAVYIPRDTRIPAWALLLRFTPDASSGYAYPERGLFTTCADFVSSGRST